jgi:hypothetical protein
MPGNKPSKGLGSNKEPKDMTKTKTKTKTKMTIEAPIFPGFYNTIISEGYHDHDSEVDHFKEQGIIPEHIDSSDVDFNYDYDKYQHDVCIAYTNALAEHLAEHGLAHNVTMESMASPQYYNYSTDRLFIDADINLERINELLKDNVDAFDKYLKDNFTSYDGFWSFIDNSPALFYEHLQALKPEYISVALRFCLELLYDGRESLDFELSLAAIDDIHLNAYLESIEYRNDQGDWVKCEY